VELGGIGGIGMGGAVMVVGLLVIVSVDVMVDDVSTITEPSGVVSGVVSGVNDEAADDVVDSVDSEGRDVWEGGGEGEGRSILRLKLRSTSIRCSAASTCIMV